VTVEVGLALGPTNARLRLGTSFLSGLVQSVVAT